MQLPGFHLDANALSFRLATLGNDPVKEAVQIALDAACTVYVYSSEGNWTGSGFHVGGGKIVTDSHVCPPYLTKQIHEIRITFDGQHLLPAEIHITDPAVDAAVLFCRSARSKPVIALGDSDQVEVGDQCVCVSSPEGWSDTASFGRIANLHQNANDPDHPAFNDVIFADIPNILPGSSGGAIVSQEGLVIGVVLGVVGQMAEYGIGQRSVCPINKVKTLLS